MVQAIIPNVSYVITTNNQTVNVTDAGNAGNPVSANIPVGIYTPTALCTAVAAAATTACVATGHVWTGTFTPLTLKATFTSTAAGTILFATGAAAGPKNNLWRLLGMTTDNGLAAADCPTGTTGACLVNVAQPLCYNVSIFFQNSTLAEVIFDNSTTRATFMLPNSEGIGELMVLTGEEIAHCEFSFSDAIIDGVTVRLFDDMGNDLDLLGAEWSLLFKQL